jgi:hypothetical protein
MSVRSPHERTPDPVGSLPASLVPAGSDPLVVQRWVSRDGVRNSIAVTRIDLEPCDWCTRPHTVDVLAPVDGEGLLCPGCCERLREELLTA